jgi:hypothetical protein
MGTGGAPEGVLAAAALRCLNGGMRGRLVPTKTGQEDRMRRMGISDPKRIYTEKDLAPGPEILFVATGVTDGALMRGVRFFGGGLRTSSIIMSYQERLIRFADSVRLRGRRPSCRVRAAARSRRGRPVVVLALAITGSPPAAPRQRRDGAASRADEARAAAGELVHEVAAGRAAGIDLRPRALPRSR